MVARNSELNCEKKTTFTFFEQNNLRKCESGPGVHKNPLAGAIWRLGRSQNYFSVTVISLSVEKL
jgi:hypothetical protein